MHNFRKNWIYHSLLLLILALAGYLRIAGYAWGEGQHQHPDELFLSGVLDSLRAKTCPDPALGPDACLPEDRRWLTPAEYLDSARSPLNPYARGYSFFVYGNLPMTITRALIDGFGTGAVAPTKLFGRVVSALVDLFSILLLYLLANKMYGPKVALLAAAFSAFTVMQIQQAHYFTVDLFVNLFILAALLVATQIATRRAASSSPAPDPALSLSARAARLGADVFRSSDFYLSIGFGVFLGMAMASKINAAVLCAALPAAYAVRYLVYSREERNGSLSWLLPAVFVIAGGMATLISFRLFQPYAFDGLGLNPQWLSSLAELRGQATGRADMPWNLQWARRTHLFSFANMSLWGMGLPMAVVAWAGFAWMGWRILRGERRHLLLWGWTALYFGWQSMQFNPSMRYQLPVYPMLAMMAAWFIWEVATWRFGPFRRPRFAPVFAASLVALSLTLTAGWAFAFHSIYLREEPRMAASRWLFANVPTSVNAVYAPQDGPDIQPLPFSSGSILSAGQTFTIPLKPSESRTLTGVVFAHAGAISDRPAGISIRLIELPGDGATLAQSAARIAPSPFNDPRGDQLVVSFDPPVAVQGGQNYAIEIFAPDANLMFSSSSIANETDYDWSLPFRIDGFDPFGGMYDTNDMLLQVYWPDDEAKIDRFVNVLTRADYIVIPTAHQYAQITRLPERYPLTTRYYRELLGCPAEADIIACYQDAQPGMYSGRLGFELVKVFESYPTLGPLVINDQGAQEDFTFYDHPKVLVFQKSTAFDPESLRAVLEQVDLSQVVQLGPADFDSYRPMVLDGERQAAQRAGGTWSELFDYEGLLNRFPILGAVVWYAFVFLMGLAAYPLARAALPGIRQYAYPLGRITALALLSWLSWTAGSYGLTYSRGTIAAAAVLIAAAGVAVWLARRAEYRGDWSAHRRFFVAAEIVFFTFFLLDLLIRLGNSDLWHPSKGGERPMDFSYFNAVLKSESFPPYDPWFAGGYINYYYYGFVLAGTPVKLLGIAPSIAYNFILPTWFALVAVGAFAIGWILVDRGEEAGETGAARARLTAALAGPFLTILLGNLGTIRTFFQALQRAVAPGGSVPVDATLLQKWGYAAQGLWQLVFQGLHLPLGPGDWYWLPSRVIPAPGDVEPITEFPLFTFIYSDLHAHMLVMPVVLAIIAWAVAFIRARARLTVPEWIATLFLGGLWIGALKPTNTWDLYTYFPLAAAAVVYTIFTHAGSASVLKKAAFAVLAAAVLYFAGDLMYAPFDRWYAQSYGQVAAWTGTRTPIGSYFAQWGLFLFLITAWMAWETRAWMAEAPLSGFFRALQSPLLYAGLLGSAALMSVLVSRGARISWVAFPLLVWAGLLLLRKEQRDAKRFVLFMIGTALALTIVVELVVLVGDIGRMNTVFKLYLQAWMLLASSAAASVGWLASVYQGWHRPWKGIFQSGAFLLVVGALLFTLTGVSGKIADRTAPDSPRTLDSMAYMQYAHHWDGGDLDLSQDYRAIRWMQDHVQGTPVIVEANCSEYRWCSRYTVYTGLPGVVGWNWHQRQQRGAMSFQVEARARAINDFYLTGDIGAALAFLERYQVEYIVVGQLEQNLYGPAANPGNGLDKFTAYEGRYWRAVYREGGTVIYQVLPLDGASGQPVDQSKSG